MKTAATNFTVIRRRLVGSKLLVNKYYDNGRIEKVTLADGSAWHFQYTQPGNRG